MSLVSAQYLELLLRYAAFVKNQIQKKGGKRSHLEQSL